MKFAEALPLLDRGQRFTVPLMKGCIVEIGKDHDDHDAMVLVSANGKRIAPWAPNLQQMRAASWQVVKPV